MLCLSYFFATTFPYVQISKSPKQHDNSYFLKCQLMFCLHFLTQLLGEKGGNGLKLREETLLYQSNIVDIIGHSGFKKNKKQNII